MTDPRLVEAEVDYCRRALSVALERALFSPSDAERAMALAAISTLEARLQLALMGPTRTLAH